MRLIKQNTAITLPCGPFLDKGDGVTAETGLSTQAGRLTKNGTGEAFTAASWSHDSNGMYLVGLSTSHTDTKGQLRLHFYDEATYLPVWEDFTVVAANVWDSIVGGTDYLDVTAYDLATQAKADVNAEVDTALGDIDLDHLAKTTYGASKPADGTLFDLIMNKDGSQTFDAATDSLEAMKDSTASVNDIADGILKRDFSAVTGESSRSLLNAARFLRNKWVITGSTLSVKEEDDSTEAWAATLTTGSADPVTSCDPG